MNRSRPVSFSRGASWWCGAVLLSGACVSNPTPHPALDATQETRGDDTAIASPNDRDACEDLGGFWNGQGCYESDSPDASLLDVTQPGNLDAQDGQEVDGSEVDGGEDGADAEVSYEGDVGPRD